MNATTSRRPRRQAGMSGADDTALSWAGGADARWHDWPGFAARVALAAEAGGVALIRLDLLDIADLEGTYGPHTAATLLAATRARLHALVGPRGGATGDGGARFAVFLADPRGAEAIALEAERLCAMVMAPIAAPGQSLRLAACAGVASATAGDGLSCDAGVLLGRAECALEAARREGAGALRLFSPEMQSDIRARTVLRQALQQAVADRRLRLHYQPVVRMADRSLAGAEALARWEHPEMGTQSPARFIPAAEETGLIVPLGEQVLHMALAQLRDWRAEGRGAPRVAVNVSGVQIRRPDFPATVRGALAEAGVPPSLLEIELTEGALIDSSPGTLAVLAELAAMGVTLAVDDFGTGYSSLRYLRDLPVHVLKIDQAFVRNLAVDSRDASIVAAIVAMARGLGLSTTAEGVQMEAQYERLREVGCDTAQGWLFGAPVRAEAFGGA